MNAHGAASPISLSYVAALRGIKPRSPGETFTYADISCVDTELLTCLAASNPEGKFYGIVADDATCASAGEKAKLRAVDNISFLVGIESLSKLPVLDYLCCDESRQALNPAVRQSLFENAAKILQPGGIFHYTYPAYKKADGALRFLVREFAPEMNAEQAQEFISELKNLGGLHLSKNPETAAKMEQALTRKIPDEFFSLYDSDEAVSGSFNTLVALNPLGFVYAGDSNIASNYVELSVMPEAHNVIEAWRANMLYEQVKDYALDRTVRSDIWCRQPVPRTDSLAELFGSFAYGIPMQREQIPTEYKAKGKTIDLSSPLFTKLIDLMALMPMTIGDFLSHPSGQGFEPTEVVGAIQILVACGLVQPMRGMHEMSNIADVNQPKLVGGFNRYLDKTFVTGSELWMASPVLGAAVSLSPRDALVIQALDRVGLANSVSALMPELERLAKNPSQAAAIMDVAEPTAEIAHNMITDVVSKSIVQWYAYGLLEAA